MKINKLLKIIIILVISFSVTFLIIGKTQSNFNNTVLNAQIDIVDDENIFLPMNKLFLLPGYPSIGNYFSTKEIGMRLFHNVSANNFCFREANAKKRPISLVPHKYSLKITMLFMQKDNAEKCVEEIQDYILRQKEVFIKETESVITNIKDNKPTRTLIKKMPDQSNNKMSSEIAENLEVYTAETQVLSVEFNYEKIASDWNKIMNAELFNLKYTYTTQNINVYLVYIILFVFISSLMSYIFFRKEINKVFDSFKDKI